MAKETIKFIDLFAGIGGIRLGLEQQKDKEILIMVLFENIFNR